MGALPPAFGLPRDIFSKKMHGLLTIKIHDGRAVQAGTPMTVRGEAKLLYQWGMFDLNRPPFSFRQKYPGVSEGLAPQDAGFNRP